MYRSITELPLSRWIDLTVDGYKKALIKQGNPPDHELLICESHLRIQYADASGDHEYRMYCNTMSEITRLEITLTQMEKLIGVLRDAYQPVFLRELNRLLGASLTLDVNDPKAYDETLDKAFRRTRGTKIRLDLERLKLVKLEEKYHRDGKGQAGREYYMSLLITLSDDAGYELNDSITVWNFLERIKRANKKADLKQKSNVTRRH